MFLILDLRARASDVLYNVVRYCLDIVSDPKSQDDLVSGLKEKELFPDLKFPLQYSNHCCVLLPGRDQVRLRDRYVTCYT